jgi:hypothetical protein
MRLAVYAGEKRITTTCTVYEYNASREFASKFLKQILRTKDSEIYSTMNLKQMEKTFGHALKETSLSWAKNTNLSNWSPIDDRPGACFENTL